MKEPKARGPVRALLVLVGSAALAQIALSVLGARSLAAEILAAFLVDMIAGRMGAEWYGEDVTPSRAFRLDLRRGAGVTFVAVALLVAVALVARLAVLRGGSPAPLNLLLGAVTAIAIAVRREVLYRWIPLRLAGPSIPRRPLEAFSVLLGAAPIAFAAPFHAEAILLALAMGVLSVALTRWTRNLAASVAAHATLLFTTSSLFTSTLDVRWRTGTLSPLDGASGIAGLAITAALVLSAAWVLRRASRIETPR